MIGFYSFVQMVLELYTGGINLLSPNQYIYALAYCVFIVGAAKSFRDNGSKLSLWIMGSGLFIDVLTSILYPVMGVEFLQIQE